jgi:hypothetical protein
MQDHVKTGQHSVWGLIFQGIVAAFLIYACWDWPRHLPAPGVAVTILAVAAFVMTFRADRFTPLEKIGWIVVALGLCVIEIRAILHDRQVAASELKEARKHEEQNFRDIANGLKAAMQRDQEGFSAAMKKSEKIISDVSDSVKMQTGGDSFAYITLTGPQPSLLTFNNITHPAGPWFLVSITSHGKYALRNINATLIDDDRRQAAVDEYNKHPDGDWIKAIRSADITFQYPYLRPQSPEAPSGDVEPIGSYPIPAAASKRLSLAFSATNGYWNEILHLGATNGQWHQCLSILGPTLEQSTRPFIWCDSDWPEGKKLAEGDWAGLNKTPHKQPVRPRSHGHT